MPDISAKNLVGFLCASLIGIPIIITAVLFIMYLPLPKRRKAVAK